MAHCVHRFFGAPECHGRASWLAQELPHKEGWGPEGVVRVGIGSGTARVTAAFRNHLVDADISATSLFLNMEEAKIGRVLIPVTECEGDAAAGDIYASDHLIATNPNAIRAFLAAWLETIDHMRSHKADTVRIESGVTGFSTKVMSREYDLTIGMFNFSAVVANKAYDHEIGGFVSGRPVRSCSGRGVETLLRRHGHFAQRAQRQGALHDAFRARRTEREECCGEPSPVKEDAPVFTQRDQGETGTGA